MEPKGSAGSVSTDGDVTEEPQAADPKGSDDSIAPEAGGSAVPGHREIAPLRLECDELRDRLERLDENNRELQYQLYSTRLDQLKLRSDRAGTNRSQSTAPRVGSHTRRRYVVYTAIAGGYDQVKLPLQISDEFDYVCFTDREIDDHNVWQVRRFEYLNRDPTRMARFVKMRPHVYFPEYEVSIWIDANLHLKGNPESFLINLLEKPFAAFVHPHRDCVYEEALEIISRGGLDDPTVVRDHMNRYRSQHFPDDSGLIETNVLVRRHNDPAVKRLMNLWWHQLVNGSKRDQLSLPYVLWRAGFEIEPLGKKGVSVRNDPRFERYLHGSGSEYSHPQLGPKHLERQEELEPTQGPFGQKIESGYQPIDTSVVDSLSMDIVICVHNSLDDVRRCLNSVIPTMLPHHKLIIVDDGSEKETAQYLFDLYNADSRIRLIRCEKAGGYTKAANIGLRSSEAEFTILLNSDTIVPARWWRKLATVAYSSPSTGIVGPLSNAASWQSVPKILDADGSLAVNPRPEDLSVDAMDDLVETSSINVFPVVDLLNGFCLGIKRAVVNEIGYFDEEAFPKGYGEENDYCFRAFEAGFRLVVATGCYVFHAKSRSYTPERRDSLATESGKAFRRKYPAPRIGNAIESTKKNPFLVRMRKRFESNQDAAIAEAESARAQVQTMRTITPRPLGSPAFFDVSVEQLEANQELQSRYAEEPCGEPRVALWFLPNFTHILRGGIRTIFSVAQDFTRTWGTTNIIAVYGKKIDLDALDTMIRDSFADLDFRVIEVADDSDPKDLPESDIAFCTLWTSAYLLVKYNKCKGKFYFAQDYEPSFYRAGTTSALIEQTYRFGFFAITNTVGVAEMVQRHSDIVGYFTPGIDHELFHANDNATKENGVSRVVFYGRPGNPRNAFNLGISALTEVKREMRDDVQIISVGAEFDSRSHGINGIIENWGVLPTMEAVTELYRSSQVGLVFMFSAHPSYQPIEFMASGCATVTNHNASNLWLLRDGYNSALVDSLVTPIADRIVRLLRDDDYRRTIVEGGLKTVSKLDWARAFADIRDFVINPINKRLPPGRSSEPFLF